jgi:tetratricopeptide (TPR) repeat protein
VTANVTRTARETLVRFADRLQRLRVAAGTPPLKRLTELTAALGRPLARSTMSDKLTGKSLPEWDFVVWFVHGCVANAREAGVRLPADLVDLAAWDAAHWRLLRSLDSAQAGERLTAAARAEIARRTDPPPDAPATASGGSQHGTADGLLSPVARLMPRQLPAPTRHFAGRAEELAALTALADEVERGDGPVIAAIDGTAGIGKTSLVGYWAHRAADRFPDGQLYVNLRGFDPAGTPMAPTEAVRGFLDALGVPAHRLPVSLETQAALYRSLLAGRRMLVVLDNARDCEQVRRLLPGSSGCLVLVTSRSRLTSLVAVEGAQPLTLDLFTPADACELLARRLGRDRLAAEPDAVDDIIAACARLPLALSIVAARAGTHPGFSLASLATELRGIGSGRGLGAFDGEPGLDLRAVFSWSYLQLDVASAGMFRLLGGHPGPDIGLRAAASLAGLPVDRARTLLAGLAGAHLVAETSPGRFAFHDLLRAYATELADTLDGDGDRGAARLRGLDHYLRSAYAADRILDPHRQAIPPPEPVAGVTPESFADRPRALAWLTAERPVLLAAVALAATTGLDPYARDLAWTLTTFLDRRGHWHDWATSQHVALEAATRLADPAGQARAHRDLARAHAQLGDHDRAHAHLRSALELFGGCADLAGEAHTHLGIGWLYQRQGRLEEALAHAERALDLFRVVGYQHGQANALNNVGSHHSRLGNHGSALTACRMALTAHREIGDLRGQADTWHNLGYANHRLGHHSRAIACYGQALDLFRDVSDRYQEAAVLTHLGDVHRFIGQPEAARRSWCAAVTILDDLGHADAGAVHDRLGRGGAPRALARSVGPAAVS